MTNSIFGSDAATQGAASAPAGSEGDQIAADPQQENQAVKKLLASIVDENGRQKYDSIEKAVEGLKHANQYIGQLHSKLDTAEAEKVALREDLASRKAVSEVVDSLAPQGISRPAQGQPTPPVSTGLSVEDAEEMFRRLFTQEQQAAVRSKNEKAVIAALSDKFGPKAEEMFVNRAIELGMNVAELNKLSGTSPNAVLELFGTRTEQASEVDLSSGINTATLGNQANPNAPGRNIGKSVLMGSTSQDVMNEFQKTKNMVAELHAEGKTVEDLTDPKEFFKVFGG